MTPSARRRLTASEAHAITNEQRYETLQRMAAYIRDHANGSLNLERWADFVADLPPDGEEARAFARSQREIGFPDPFTPRCDDGLYMRSYGLKDTPPPHAGVLRELVALEGMEEPLPPGAIFPMDPTPVREDGLPLWEVEVVLVSDEDGLWDMWQHVERLEHPCFESSGSYGQGPCHYDTRMRIWAVDADEARTVADALVDQALDGRPARRRLTASPAYADEYFDLPRRPEDYEPGLGRRRWQRFVPTAAGVKVVWSGGVLELARVDVDETPERVTIALWERYPPRFLEGGMRVGIPAVGRIRAVEVPLHAPLADRELIDGATGHPPGYVDEFDLFVHELPDDVDVDRVPVQPMPP